MSGGVDSSVAAAMLVREGHEVVGCFMRLGSPGESLDTALIRTLIELTGRHGKLKREDLDEETRHFLDCDMAILGAPAGQFDAYDAAIAQEYREVPKLIYTFNRNRFLKHLLDVERIFLSDLFHSRFDVAARANLRRAYG